MADEMPKHILKTWRATWCGIDYIGQLKSVNARSQAQYQGIEHAVRDTGPVCATCVGAAERAVAAMRSRVP